MARWWNRRRFDSLELCAIALFSGLSAWFLSEGFWVNAAMPEVARLQGAYGPSRYSRGVEEWIIRDFFGDRRGGFFVDVGANHYRKDSNSFYLDERLGWSGIAIDPLPQFEADYRKYRPRTSFFALFVSDVSDQRARLFVSDRNSEVSSASREFTEAEAGGAGETTVPTITLTDLLNQQRVVHIDLLSIDVELSEPKVLAGFDIDRFKPALVCIEAHGDVRQQILNYFARHGYVTLGKYLRADVQNLYFVPLS